MSELKRKKEDENKRLRIAENFTELLKCSGVDILFNVDHQKTTGCMNYQEFNECRQYEIMIAKHLVVKEKGNHPRRFLIIIDSNKKIDLKSLKEELGTKRLSFESSTYLDEYLKTEPGSVSIFHKILDYDNQLEIIIDEPLLQAEVLPFHPLVNLKSIFISSEGVTTFLNNQGYEYKVIDIPELPSQRLKKEKII